MATSLPTTSHRSVLGQPPKIEIQGSDQWRGETGSTKTGLVPLPFLAKTKPFPAGQTAAAQVPVSSWW